MSDGRGASERSTTTGTTTTSDCDEASGQTNSEPSSGCGWPTRASDARGGRGEHGAAVARRLTGLTIDEKLTTREDGAPRRTVRGETSTSQRETRSWARFSSEEEEEELEHELLVDGRTLKWMAAGVLRAKYSCTDAIEAACWCSFDSTEAGADATVSRREWFMCALHRDSFSLFGVNGEMRTVSLEFETISSAATSQGLLFLATDGRAHLLSHSLDEPSVVPGFESSSETRVMWSSPRRSDVITFDASRSALESWSLVRESVENVIDSGGELDEYAIRARREWFEHVECGSKLVECSVVHDVQGCELAILSDSFHGKIFAIPTETSVRASRRCEFMEGLCAIGVSATRADAALLDTVLLCIDGTLMLCMGLTPICKLEVNVANGAQLRTISSMRRHTDDQIVVQSSQGSNLSAIIHLPGSFTSPLTKSVMRALRDVLSVSEYFEILTRMYECDDVGMEDPDGEWRQLKRIVQRWIGVAHAVSDENGDWDFASDMLLSAHFSARDQLDGQALLAEVSHSQARAKTVLSCVHALYEACKVDLLVQPMMKPLRDFGSVLAGALDDGGYIDYYARDAEASMAPHAHAAYSKCVPDLLRAIERMLAGEHDFYKRVPPLIFAGLEKDAQVEPNTHCGEIIVRARKLVHLCQHMTGTRVDTRHANGSLASMMTQLGMTICDLERIPQGLALPLHIALRAARASPSSDWSKEAHALIGRKDMIRMCDDDDVLKEKRVKNSPNITNADGLEHLESFIGPLRFPRDYRIREVRTILATSSPVPISLEEGESAGGDAEQGSQQQAKLMLLAARTAATPVGRGAASLGTIRAKPTEALRIPQLCFAGCLPSQQYAVVNLDLTSPDAPRDFASWPEFHNGAAAGLTLDPETSGDLNRAWIVFNRPKVPTFEHAGVLMSLGLNGHLSGLTATDLYRYLAQEHEATTIGTLLGVSASKIGTADPGTSRMCFLHLPTRHPSSFPEIELPTLVQSCALVSVGLLYQATAQRLIVETLLSELGKSPEGDSTSGKECYALSAGIALGLVTLGCGQTASGLSDLHIAERLRHFTLGGVSRLMPSAGGVASSPSRRATGISSDNFEGDSFFRHSENFTKPPSDGYTLEGSMVNVDLSAPGAMMALGMMYLKTNDVAVASHLEIPSTHYALDNTRPDYVLLKVVTRNLIMWDSIEPSVSWVENLLPPILRDAMNTGFSASKEAKNDTSWLGEADREAIAQTYVNAISGACMSIGLRYAGTSNSVAAGTVRHFLLQFINWKRTTNGEDKTQVNRNTLEVCIGTMSMALSCIMAGTGDLPTFRILRHLRSRLEASSTSSSGLTYGAHMAINMANGFLFLGGGTQTFSTSNASIAALLIAMFPTFPFDTSDNRWHCQAFRHLYVLAAKKRLLNTTDADTGEPVSAPIEMVIRDLDGEQIIQVVTPCLLPEPTSLHRIRVISPRYWPTDLDFSGAGQHVRDRLYDRREVLVQRHANALSYEVDRTGVKAQLATALHAAGASAALKPPSLETSIDHNTAPMANATAARAGQDVVNVFTTDKMLTAFTKHLCDGSNDRAGYAAAALRECTEGEIPEALRLFIDLYSGCEHLINQSSVTTQRSGGGCLNVANMRLLEAFDALARRTASMPLYSRFSTTSAPKLLVQSFRRTVLHSFESTYGTGERNVLLARYLRGEGYDSSLDSRALFGSYLRFFDTPNPKLLRSSIDALLQLHSTQLDVAALRRCLPNVDPATIVKIIETSI